METHKYSIFLGCVIPNRLPQIEAATRLVAPKLGIELVEMEGASCCPAPGVIKSFDIDTWLSITARNIALSEENGLDILVMCNGCYGTLIAGVHELKDPTTRKRINKILKDTGHQVKGTATAKHLVEVLYLRRQYDYGSIALLPVQPHELVPVHLWHHQIQHD